MKQSIIDLLDNLSVAYEVVQHEPVFTVSDTARVLPDKAPVKNLFLKDNHGDRLFLVVMNGLVRLDMKQLASDIGVKKLSFGNEPLLQKTLQATPGSVSLFGLLCDTENSVELIIDETIKNEERVGFHPNINTETIFISGESLEKITTELCPAVTWMKF